MQLLQSFAVQLPMIIACAVFLIAAIFKVGKEKGAGLVAVGAVGLCLLVISNPLFNYLFMSEMVSHMDPEAISYVFLIKSVVSNLLWAVAIALVATGTFLRSPNVEAS
ncbi:MAG: hypothetical protein ACR2NF_10505 [Pirellulales bacterium]